MKKVLSLALAMALCFSLTVSASAASSKSNFTDVATNAYYADAVSWAVKEGITSGTSATTFSPDQTCTTAQILTFLWRSQNQPVSTIQNPYHDVKSSDYYYQAALWAHQKGLVSGRQFNGDAPCTRSATVAYLWKLAGHPSAPAANFADVPSDANYALAVAWAVSEGITSGTSTTTFSPNSTCTRGQIVTFLYRDLAETASEKQGLAYYGLKPTAELDKEYSYTTYCRDNGNLTTTGTVKFTDYTRKSLGNGYDEVSISIVWTFSDDAAYEYGFSVRGTPVDYYLYTVGDKSSDSIYAGKTVNWNGKAYTECSDSAEPASGGWDGHIATVSTTCTAKIPAEYDGFVVTAYSAEPNTQAGADSTPLPQRDNLIMFRCD